MDDIAISTLKSMIGNVYKEPKLEPSVHKEPKKVPKLKPYLNCIKECLAYSNLITIFDVKNANGHRGIDIAISHAIIKAQPDFVSRFKFAIIMDKLDLMEDDVFSKENWHDHRSELDNVLLMTIALDRVQVMKLFLDRGFSIGDRLTWEQLTNLYINTQEIPLGRVNNLIRKLAVDSFESLAKYVKKQQENSLAKKDDKRETGDKTGDQTYASTAGETHTSTAGGTNDGTDYETYSETDDEMYDEMDVESFEYFYGFFNKPVENCMMAEDEPYLHLFLWSVLLLRQDLAKLFLTKTKNPTFSALIAQTILRSMLKGAKDGNLKATITSHINELSSLTHGVLDLAFSSNFEKTRGILLDYNNLFGHYNCMRYALSKGHKDFIAHAAPQLVLKGMLRGKINADTSLWRIFFCVLCPFLMFPLLTFDKVTDEQQKEKKSNVLEEKKDNMKSFLCAPVVIFMYNVLSHLAFLCLYAYIIVVDFNADVSNAEIVLIVWVVSFLTEEIRQILMGPSPALFDNIKTHYTDVWNVTDTMVIVMFFTGVILRLVPRNDGSLGAARVVLAVAFIGFFLRLLHVCSIHKKLGPKLVMMGNMIVDLLYFLVILMVFVISYAVAAQSILYPNSPLSWRTARQLVSKSYWNIYGELGLDEFEGDDCADNTTLWIDGGQPRCPTDLGKIVVPILLGIYMIIANVLLLNLLIAMFSYTFSSVQEKSHTHWCYQRCLLVEEFSHKPFLVPPLNVLYNVTLLLEYIFEIIQFKTAKFWATQFGNFLNENKSEWDEHKYDSRQTSRWESMIVKAYQLQTLQQKANSTQGRVNQTNTTLEEVLLSVKKLTQYSQAAEQEIKDMKQKMSCLVTSNANANGRTEMCYPGTSIARIPVPDGKSKWQEPLKDYYPETYTAVNILSGRTADPDLQKMQVDTREKALSFNEYDAKFGVDRSSVVGAIEVRDGFPLNPTGRTGIQGRGVFPRWGPNQYVRSVVTRWTFLENGLTETTHVKPVLEVLVVSGSRRYCLPETEASNLSNWVGVHLKLDIPESSRQDVTLVESLRRKLKRFQKKGVKLYKNFLKDERNTDNAWIEIEINHFHDGKGALAKYLVFKNDGSHGSCWLPISEKTPVSRSDLFFINRAAQRMGAGFQ